MNFAVLVDALNDHATVFSLHETRQEAETQSEIVDGIVRIAREGVREGERYAYDQLEAG